MRLEIDNGYFIEMSENVNIGDTLIVTTSYGRFKGEVYKLNKMANNDFSLKLIKVYDVEKVRVLELKIIF